MEYNTALHSETHNSGLNWPLEQSVECFEFDSITLYDNVCVCNKGLDRAENSWIPPEPRPSREGLGRDRENKFPGSKMPEIPKMAQILLVDDLNKLNEYWSLFLVYSNSIDHRKAANECHTNKQQLHRTNGTHI